VSRVHHERGSQADLEIPPGIRWTQSTDQLPVPVEWSARVQVRARPGWAWLCAATSRRSAHRRINTRSSPRAGPGALDTQAFKALAVGDEMSIGLCPV